jgi:hypothetical protein
MHSARSKGQDARAGRWARQGGNSTGMFAGGVSRQEWSRDVLCSQCSMRRGRDAKAVPRRELSREMRARAAHLECGLPAAAEQGGLGRVQGPAQVPPHVLALKPGKEGFESYPGHRAGARAGHVLAHATPHDAIVRFGPCVASAACDPLPRPRRLLQPRACPPLPAAASCGCTAAPPLHGPERAGAVSVASERRPQRASSST